jgi:ribosomal protein S1
MIKEQLWNQVKTKYQLGKLIYGKVEFHAPSGVLVNIGDENVKGIIQITYKPD